jgi:hypothetical protein
MILVSFVLLYITGIGSSWRVIAMERERVNTSKHEKNVRDYPFCFSSSFFFLFWKLHQQILIVVFLTLISGVDNHQIQ